VREKPFAKVIALPQEGDFARVVRLRPPELLAIMNTTSRSLSFAAAAAFLPFIAACSAENTDRGAGPIDLVDTGLTADTQAAADTDLFVPDMGSMETTPLEDGGGCATAEAAAVKQPVDVIIVIDQSGSMNEEIIQVRDNINKLSAYLNATKLDYRVIMIAGMPGNGSLPMCVPEPLAGPSCASKAPRYRAVNRHIESWDALKWVIQTYDSTDTTTKWSDMLRVNAIKVFIPITDDDANDSFLPVPRSTSFDDMILSRGSGTFGTKSKRKYVFYPICGVSTTSTSTKCSTAVNTGPVYVELATLTKGKAFSVCEPNYEPVFQAIGKAIATSVACEVAVPAPPAGETFDPAKVNVVYKDSGGGSTVVPQDTSADCYGGANGWQYSSDGTKILLCGTACAAAKSDPGAVISVQFGCKTIIAK